MLPKALKLLRTNRKMSQRELADIIGVSQQTIGSWEVGRTSPDPDMINKLAQYFNVPTDYLLGNDSFPGSRPGTFLKFEDQFTAEEKDYMKKHDGKLPPLTPKDEREISKDLEDMIHSLSGSAAMGDPEDEEDLEMLKASLKQAMMLSKRIAKKKFTPKKYK